MEKTIMDIKGETRKERIAMQLNEWVNGNSIHNKIDNECCPDFSCCHPDLLASKIDRETYKALYKKSDNDSQAYDAQMGMLYGFLAEGIAKALPDKKVFIADGNTEIKKDLN